MPSSGPTPTATIMPPRSLTATAGCWGNWRFRAARRVMRGCWAWSSSERRAGAAGRWGEPAAAGPGGPASRATRGGGGPRSTGPKRPRGRNGAKTDALDAIRAGREALGREHLAVPRQRGQREALRVLQLTRSGAVKVAADGRRHLKALLVTAPEPLRQSLRSGTWLVQARGGAVVQ